jgi:hypothetical protein
MDLKPLGKRDIFGILLPGALLVLVSAYVLFGALVVLQLPVKSLLEHEVLLAVILFVVSYLVGSILRLYAADDVDNRSSRRFSKAWEKKYRTRIKNGRMSESDFEELKKNFRECKAKLARGDDVSDIPDGFDKWLWQVDSFPYRASMNRIWQVQGRCEELDFFRTRYKTSMWSESRAFVKNFFNYCKLVIIKSGGGMADEINMAEGLTRFFAGTFAALRLSVSVLCIGLVFQLLLVAMLILVPRWGITLPFPAQWTVQGFYSTFTLALIFVLRWICRLIVKRFRVIRMKEAEVVYYAFYLQSTSLGDGNSKKGQQVPQETLA